MSDNSTEKLNGTFDEKLDWLIVAVQSLDSRLVNLDTKVDKRLRETQPMWEAVQSQLAEVRESLRGQGELLQSQGELLQSQGDLLQNHSELLQSQGELLQRQGELLQSHGELLQRQGEDIAGLRADTEKGFRTIDRRMERQLGEFERLHAYQRDLEDRIDRIEKLQTP